MSTRAAITLFGRSTRLAHRTKITQYHNTSIGSVLPQSSWRGYATEKSAEQTKPQDADPEVSKQLEELDKEVKALKEEKDELLDKYRRSLADSENLRVRLNKQISDAKIYGIQGFCKDLLEVADTLGNATQSVPQEQLEQNQTLNSLYQGLVMTQASLLQVFKRHGLTPLNPVNEKFDPNVHEALFTKEDNTVEPNTVIVVTKLGYKLHDRCIRPALVGVSKS